MKKMVLNNPDLNTIRDKLSCTSPEEIEITFKNEKDNTREFEIIDYLIHGAGYFLEDLKAADGSKKLYIAHFKRKS